MDRPCYEKTFSGFKGEVELLEQAIKWIKEQSHILVKEVSYKQDCVYIIYEGFPDSDEMMMKYWEQETGKPHPSRVT